MSQKRLGATMASASARADVIVDLSESPAESSQATNGVARMPPPDPPAASFVNLLYDDDDDDESSTFYPFSSSPRRRKRKRTRHGKENSNQKRTAAAIGAFKTDPNERFEVKQTTDDKKEETIQVAGTVAASNKPAELPVQVLEVFPDVDLGHVEALLQQHNNNVPVVVSILAEKNGSYPKTKKKKMPPPVQGASGMQSVTTTTRDYMSTATDKSFQPSELYKTQALEQLLHDFPFLSRLGATKILTLFKYHYAICHDKILTAVKGTAAAAGVEQDLEKAQYDRLQSAFAGNPLNTDQTSRLNKVSNYKRTALKHPRASDPSRPSITDSVLKEEIAYVKAKLKEWMKEVRKRTDREMNKKKSQQAGTAVECSCCFDEDAIDNMVACRQEGHLFCVNCFQSYAENQIFANGNLGIDKETKQPALELKCFHGEGCSSGFERAFLEKAFSHKLLKKYDELQYQITIERAGLTDLCSCPKCSFQAALPPSMKIFQCPACQYESFRECGEPAHIPLRCDEVEKQEETKGRLTVEEAITNAKIRTCPACGKAFIKSDGCNKVRCGCGAYVCYICRKKIPGNYTHFCQTPHCRHESCNTCPLYTNDQEDDARAMREAGLQAASKVHSQSMQDQDEKKKGTAAVDIDVESILEAGVRKNKK